MYGEEVITLLSGKRHVTLEHFVSKCRFYPAATDKNCFTLARYARDVPRGEIIARAGIASVVHPIILARFGCYEPERGTTLSSLRKLICYVRFLPAGGDLSLPMWGDEAEDTLKVCRPLGVEIYKPQAELTENWTAPVPPDYRGNHGMQFKPVSW